MEDMAGEEGLEEDAGDLEEDEEVDSEAGSEGEEDTVGDGKSDGYFFLSEGGLIPFRARKARRWRHGGGQDYISGNQSQLFVD